MSEWKQIKCPKCHEIGNYKPTISGTSPCRTTRCTWLIDVGEMTEKERLKQKEELDSFNKEMMDRSK